MKRILSFIFGGLFVLGMVAYATNRKATNEFLRGDAKFLPPIAVHSGGTLSGTTISGGVSIVRFGGSDGIAFFNTGINSGNSLNTKPLALDNSGFLIFANDLGGSNFYTESFSFDSGTTVLTLVVTGLGNITGLIDFNELDPVRNSESGNYLLVINSGDYFETNSGIFFNLNSGAYFDTNFALNSGFYFEDNSGAYYTLNPLGYITGVALTGGNGLTRSGDIMKLGGTLSESTTIFGDGQDIEITGTIVTIINSSDGGTLTVGDTIKLDISGNEVEMDADGLVYSSDFSGSWGNRNLPDKGYVDSEIIAGGNVEDGTETGQIVFWGGTSEYKHTETGEVIWDDVNKRLGIGIAVPLRTLDIGGISSFRVGADPVLDIDSATFIAKFGDINGAGDGTLFTLDDTVQTFTFDVGKVILDSGTGINEFSIDGTLAGDSDDAVPTEKAVKTYVDNSTTPPGGSATHVQFNSGGSDFGGQSDFTYSGTTETVTMSGLVVSSPRVNIATGLSTDIAFQGILGLTVTGDLGYVPLGFLYITSGTVITNITNESNRSGGVEYIGTTAGMDEGNRYIESQNYIYEYDGATVGRCSVGGIVYVKTGNVSTPALALGDGDSGIYEDGDDVVSISSSGLQIMHFENVGDETRVGIGTTTDSAAFHVYEFSTLPGIFQRDSASNDSKLRALEVHRTTTTTAEEGIGAELGYRVEDDGGNLETVATIGAVLNDASSAGEEGTLIFELASDSSLFEAVRFEALTSDVVEVGIGTSAPDATLDVVGVLQISGTLIDGLGNNYRSTAFEAWGQLFTNSATGTLSLPSDGVYVGLTGLTEGLIKNVTSDLAVATGDQLIIGLDGTYTVCAGLSFEGTINTDFHMAVFKNGVKVDQVSKQRKIGTSSDVGDINTCGLATGSVGDVFGISMAPDGNSKSIIFNHASLVIDRIGEL